MPIDQKLAGTEVTEHAMSQTHNFIIAVIGIDIGKNSFDAVGHDQRGAAAAEVVTRPDGNAAREYPALPDRHGGV
jgi:hypothetical protein